MYKAIFFFQKKKELSLEEFKAYYEEKHVPLMEKVLFSQIKPPLEYRRNYLHRDQEIFSAMYGMQSSPVDFDVVVEFVYENEAHFQEMGAAYGKEEIGTPLGEDEGNFIDKSLMRMYTVDVAGS